MTRIGRICQRSAACAAWSPVRGKSTTSTESNSDRSNWIVLGTKDGGGAVGGGFNSSHGDGGGELEIYDICQLQDNNAGPMAAVATPARLTSIVWSAYTNNNNGCPDGVVVAGLANGVVQVYDVAAVIHSAASTTIATLPLPDNDDANTTVSSLHVHPTEPHQVAIGTTAGQVWLLDLRDDTLSLQLLYQEKAETSAVAWNPQVSNIVASAHGALLTIYDVTAHLLWSHVRAEHAHQVVSAVVWHPQQGLQVLTVAEQSGEIKLWDLAVSTSMPIQSLPHGSAHTAGILDLAWCPHDVDLVLTCGKDHKTFLWDLGLQQAVAELVVEEEVAPAAAEAAAAQVLAVQPTPSSLFAAKAGSLQPSQQAHDATKAFRYQLAWSPLQRGLFLTCSLDRTVEVHSVGSLLRHRPPQWLRPQSAVACSFGSTLVSCQAQHQGWVTMTIVPDDADCVAAGEEMEQLLAEPDVMLLCQNMAGRPMCSPADRTIWGFMQVIFAENSRQELLQHLGYNTEAIAQKAAALDDESLAGSHASLNGEMPRPSHKAGGGGGGSSLTPATRDIIQQALVVGDFGAAVECCIRAEQFADALVLAAMAGGDLWTTTQERFYASQSSVRSYLSIVQAISRGEVAEWVSTADLAAWEECLALLSRYAASDTFPGLCVALGGRLEEEAGDRAAASLCYLCALDLARSSVYWMTQLERERTASRLTALQAFVAKIVVLQRAVGSHVPLPDDVADIFTEYAERLADQGLFVAAAKYCLGSSDRCLQLRDRLYRGRASQHCLQAMGNIVPQFPFDVVLVEQSRQPTQTLQPQAKSRANLSAHHQAQGNHQPHEVAQQTNVAQQHDLYQGQAYQERSAQHYEQQGPSTDAANTAPLPDGWIAIQDPSSGSFYYAHESSGAVQWERPTPAVAPAPVTAPSANTNRQEAPMTDVSTHSQSSLTSNGTAGNKKTLASKYGDGFVSSASDPRLAEQYGNVGTSNPYGGGSRPGTASAAAAARPISQPPLSGTMNFESLEISSDIAPIKDTLLGYIEAVKGTTLLVADRRQLAEAEKGVAILIKKLARGDVDEDLTLKISSMVYSISMRDFVQAGQQQTALANTEWRDHKDWLKGVKFLIQLSAKRFS